MQPKNLLIESASLGERLLLVDVKPAQVYKNNEAVPNQYDGFKYRVLLLDKDLDNLWVKGPGPQAINLKDRAVKLVRFENIQIRCDEIENRPVVSAKATRIIEIKE